MDSICKASSAAWPTSEPQLLRAVAHAVHTNQKIRVVSRHAHSASKLFCVEDEGLVISTQNYDSVIEVNRKAMTITVQAGAIMSDVIDTAAEKGSGVYEYVVGMRIVVPASPSQGYAKIVTLTEADEDLKAAKLSLGTLGAISEITFALQRMFKRSVSVSVKDDYDLENEAERFLRAHTFGDIRWLPSHRKAVFLAIDRVSVDVAGDGASAMTGAPPRVADITTCALSLTLLSSPFH